MIAGPYRAIIIGSAVSVVGVLPVFLTAALAVQLTTEFAFGEVGHGAVIGAFYASMALTSYYLGGLVDRRGAIFSLRLASLCAAGPSLAIAVLAHSLPALAAGLVLGGPAAALAQPAANRLLVNRVEPTKLGTAFGLKQSAPPLAAFFAGLAVPAIALTLGWRWAFVLVSMSALGTAVAVGPLPSRRLRAMQTSYVESQRLPNRRSLLILAVSFGLASASVANVTSFLVLATTRTGISQGAAGLILALASLAAIATRLLSGIACDRLGLAPLRLSAVLLGLGAGGSTLLLIGTPVWTVVGGVIAMAGVWGFSGLFWHGLVRAYPTAPGRVTGRIVPATLGAVVGPIAWGVIATHIDYAAAWGMTSVLAIFAAATMAIGGFRLQKEDLAGPARPVDRRRPAST